MLDLFAPLVLLIEITQVTLHLLLSQLNSLSDLASMLLHLLFFSYLDFIQTRGVVNLIALSAVTHCFRHRFPRLLNRVHLLDDFEKHLLLLLLFDL